MDRHVRDVGQVRVDVAITGRLDVHRLHADHVIEDREIVRREVPEHVHVGLEKAQVDPQRVVVRDLAERAASGELAQLLHRAREQERVVDEQRDLLPRGERDQLLALGGARAHRLLDQYVLAALDRAPRQREVRRHRRRDQHRGDVGAVDGRLGLGFARRAGRHAPRLFEPRRIALGDRLHLEAARRDEIAQQVRPPVAEADQSSGNHPVVPPRSL